MTKQEIGVARQRLRLLVGDCFCASKKADKLIGKARGLIEKALAIEASVFRPREQ